MKSILGRTFLLFLAVASAARAESLMTDRPGFTFSGMTVGRGVFQAELGLPSVMLDDLGDEEMRSTSLFALLRYGVTERLELRVGGPLYTERRVEMAGMRNTERGFGDVEVGLKWGLLHNQGSRPAVALIPSVILPVGEDGFTADDPVYQLNLAAEWMSADWDLMTTAGILDGKSGGQGYNQETLAVWLGRTLSSGWIPYGEAVYISTDLDGASDSSFLGAGFKYLISDDLQFDASVDRGLTEESPDWMLGLGFSARF